MATSYQERKALQEGYTRQGAYSWRQEEMKQRAAELRKQGHKAKIVYIPGNPLSRSSTGGGYAVMWIENPELKKARIIAEAEARVSRAVQERDSIAVALEEKSAYVLKLQEDLLKLKGVLPETRADELEDDEGEDEL